ncbi:MAG: TraB/GumN family protein [Pseudomonadota bacterium]
MTRLPTLLLCAAFLILPQEAMAKCFGRDLLQRLEVSDKTAHDAIFERAEMVPNASGRFWRIDKPGVTPSYLFGTYHDPGAHKTVQKEVWEAVEEARATWFELSIEEQTRMQTDITANPLELVFDFEQPPLSQRVPRGTLGTIRRALEARGIPLESAEQMRGWMLFSLLGFPACQLAEIQSGTPVLDDRLANHGLENGVPNNGLETYEAALAALERMAGEDFSEMMVDLSVTVDADDDIHETNMSLYASGDIQAIFEFGIWYAEEKGLTGVRERAEAFSDAALVARNRAWMGKLVPELDQGSVFVGVGALHLPGEEGMVELIRGAGFEVTRLD